MDKKFKDLRDYTFLTYDNEMYKNDESTINVLALFQKAENLGDSAQRFCVENYSYNFALKGHVYVKAGLPSVNKMIEELKVVGIVCVGRGDKVL